MRRVLVLNFFPAFVPPSSGGELRYFNLYRELSAYYDITLLSPTYSHHKEEVVTHSRTFREYRVPKERVHDQFHMAIDREEIGMEISALVCALCAKYPTRYHRAYLRLYPEADLVIHDSPYMVDYDLFLGFDDKPRVYNSYNYEALLVSQMWGGPYSQKYKDYIYELEKRLCLKSDLLFATSPQEQETFIREFRIDDGKVKIASNGINPEIWSREPKRRTSGRIRALFIGSGHPPNLEAVDFIVEKLSKRCPEIDFYIAGSCCRKLERTRGSNIHLLGRVGEKEKEELFCNSDIAINPMFSGAGTNLKTLEFMSSGCPLISTSVGVRGLSLNEDKHFILADRENFAEKLLGVAGNRELLDEIARAGQEYINSHYTWAKIGEEVRDELEKLKVGNGKKVILLLNDFEVSHPSAGGEIRINRLYACLSAYYRILLLCLNNDGMIKHTEITPDFSEISFPKSPEHLAEEKERNSRFWVSVTDIVNSEMCERNEFLAGAAACIGSKVHAVIFSHPYLEPLVDTFKNENIVYESLNCEYELKKSLLKGHPDYKGLIRRVGQIEREIAERSKFLVSVSDDDHEGLARLIPSSKEIVTIQNGVDIKEDHLAQDYPAVKESFKGYPVIIFVGSGHKPNVDALNYIIAHLAPRLQHCYFAIIGTVCNAIQQPVPRNVLLFGKLDEDYKDVLLRVSDVAINPVTSGSGSNLKLAEYFANKIPVVTTPIGARGYRIENDRHACICPESEFADKIPEVLTDENLRKKLIENAFTYAKQNLDWGVLAKRFQHLLRMRLSTNREKRLLALTYRFTDPPLGGAELYLLNVIKELDRLGHFMIDIAALDIRDVYNEFHFSTRYTFSPADSTSSYGKDISVIKFRTDELPAQEKYSNAAELFRIWMKEFMNSSMRFIEFYSEPILMGGWHFPEKMNNRAEVWSSGESLVYVKGAEDIEIVGWSPEKRLLKIWLDEEVVFDEEVSGNLRIHLPLQQGRILRLVIDPILLEGVDPRPLGIRISRILYQIQGKKKEFRLDYHYREFLKEKYLDEYVNEMIRIAQARNSGIDSLFQSTRGPLSEEMEQWLDRNTKDYDIILGHSIPFRTSVLAVRYAKKYGKPVVLLPHFHFDDEFYHWKSYYEALQQADGVIAAPKESIRLFYEKIQAKTKYVPGGLSPEEFRNVDSSVFRKSCPSPLPFVLFLGRKSGAKNYRWIIEAVKEINRQERICNLVMIGQDEDGVTVSEAEAICLGQQPREVVLGALKECLCLINMSESESFGIVILEAWMFKRPVIASGHCAAFKELVIDGANGLLASPNNLAEKIHFLISHLREAEAMGEAGHKTVAEKYTWSNIGKQIDDLLIEEVCSKLHPNLKTIS